MKKSDIFLLIMLLIMSGCSSGIKIADGTPGEKLLWSSQEERPIWTVEEPLKEGDNLLFVGISEKYSSETEGRNKALQAVTDRITNYLGSLAHTKYEKVAVSMRLSSKVADPTVSAQDYRKQVSNNLVRKVRPKQWYIEKWKTPSGTGWKVFVLADVPLKEINEGFNQAAEKKLAEARIREENLKDREDKKRTKKLIKFWETMTREGIIE